MEKRYDQITEIEKTAKKKSFGIVEKFNPFHGYHGYFSSANAMTTYSANPKTRAGQLAIGRSAPNHGDVLNVHRESKGENIRQNQHWIQTGQKPAVPAAQQASAGGGGSGSSAATKPGITHKPTSAKLDANGVPEGQVNGKNISKTFAMDDDARYDGGNGQLKSAADQVAEAQGFKGLPTVVSEAELKHAAKNSGIIMYRTINEGYDIVKDGAPKTSSDTFVEKLMYGGPEEFALNGTGYQAYGGGMYTAANKKILGTLGQGGALAYDESTAYSASKKSRTVAMTLSPTARIANKSQIDKKFMNLSKAERKRFNYDVGAYAAALGYDAIRIPGAGVNCDYITVFNRTALIICEDLYGNGPLTGKV